MQIPVTECGAFGSDDPTYQMRTGPLQIVPGSRIAFNKNGIGELELIKFLGGGAFGVAWQVIDLKSKRHYALKIVQDMVGDIDTERLRLEAEVAIVSDYVIPVMGMNQWDENTFLILFEYFEGKALDRWLKDVKLTSEEKRTIFNQILFGVADAHLNNIIHRDLKPANVLVSEDMNVRLIDFGVSKFKDNQITREGHIFGTIPYMAPELFVLGSKYADATTDIYSLGQLLYELVTGRNLWSDKGWKTLPDFFEFLKASPVRTEVMDLENFACDFYENADDVILKMVKITPSERYLSVEEIIEDLCIAKVEQPSTELQKGFPVLIIESGSNRNARTFINISENDSVVLGRSDFAGNDESISRKHIEISRRNSRFYLMDVGSKNGTMAAGALLQPFVSRELRHADRIKIGDLFLRFAFMQDNDKAKINKDFKGQMKTLIQ